eukprot:Em0011g1031a
MFLLNNTINIDPLGQSITWNGQVFRNNSLVSLSAVQPRVTATTSFAQAPLVCQEITGGQWYDPSGVLFPLATPDPVSTPGGLGQRNVSGGVELYRGTPSVFPHGVQCCTNTTITLCVGMYSDLTLANAINLAIQNGYSYALSVAATYGPNITGGVQFQLLTPTIVDPPVFQLTCTSTSSPPTDVLWTTNGGPVSNTSSQIVTDRPTSTYNNTLTVTGRAYRMYTCTVTTTCSPVCGGFTFNPRSTTSSLTVQAPPGPPTGVTAVQSGPTSVSVSWTASTSGGPVTRYDIYYVANGGPSTSGGSTNSTSYVLTNLEVGVQYNISVIAVGTSLPSLSANVILTLIPSTPSLTIAQVTSTSITAMWSQPGGEIGTTYILSYTYQGPCAGAGGGGSVSVGNATQYTITGLQEFSAYTLTITASIGVGSSPPASVLVNTSSAAPTAPPNNLTETTKTSSSVTISWGEVPCQDQNSVIVGYRVLYGAVTSGVGGTVATSGRTLTVNGLSPYTNYSIEVSAINSDRAMGPYSSPLFVVTDQSTPGPGLQDFNKTFTTITLTWQPPPVPNGVIIMYQVTYSTNGVVNTHNRTTPPVIITGLVPRTTYIFSVTAYTITGPGTPQQVQTSTADIPHVTGVVVSAINTTSVRVFWLAVQLPPDGILTGYTVYYFSLLNTSKRQSGGYTNHTFPPTTTWGDINNLNPNGVYQFSVVAQVTIMGQLYSGEMDTSLVNTPTITPVSSNLVSTSYWGGVLAGSLVTAFVVLAVAMVIIVFYYERKIRNVAMRSLLSLLLLIALNRTSGQSIPLNGQVFRNNSLVTLSVVLQRVNSTNTDLYPLVCQGITGGQWYEPNGVLFPLATPDPVSTPGGLGQRNVSGGVELYRGTPSVFPHGVQCCTNTTITLCVGMYSDLTLANATNLATSNGYNYALSVAATYGPNITGGVQFQLLTPTNVDPPVFQLTCTSTSSPPTDVLWTTDGSPVSNTFSQILTDRPTSTYNNILTVTGRAYGMYTCTVTTTCSPVCGGFTFNPRSTTSSLTVEAPPGPPSGVTAVQSGPTSVSVSWTAPTSGGPVTRYDIYYVANGGPSTSGRSTNSTSYDLTNLQVGVQYNISAIAMGTSLPSLSANVILTLSECCLKVIKVIHPSLLFHSTSVPSTPSLTIAQVTSTSIIVMWSQPGGEIGTTYTLSYIYQGPCAGAGGGGSVSVGNATQYIITGLQEFSASILTITASIGVGRSPPASVLVNTSSATPTAPPNNLTEATKTSSSVTISWGEVPCQDQNSVIVEYRVLYGAVTSGVGGTVATSGRTLTVNGLSPYTNYSIEVSAVNSDGAMGPYSSSLFVVTDQSTPGPVTGLQAFNQTFTTITLTWQPPPVPNGVIIMYQVTYSTNGVVNTYNTTTPPVTITGLVPRTTYTFSVTAYTITGPGTPQQVQTSTADIPHVTGVVVSAMNTTSVRVSWLAVQLPPDGILTGYTVYYLSLPNTSKRQSGGYTSHTLPPTTTWGDINNLNPNGVYQFSVVAQVTIMGQLYSGETDTSLVITLIVTPVSSNLVSTSYWGGVLAGSLVTEFVVLAVAMVIIVFYYERKRSYVTFTYDFLKQAFIASLINVERKTRKDNLK